MRSATPGELVAAVLAATTASCATARPLAPLREGQVALEVAAPSVLFASDPPLRIPSPTVGARYGLTNSTEVRLTLHPLHLFLEHRPILGIGTGAIFHVSPADGWIPALHFTADLTLFAPLSGGGGPAAIVLGDAAVIVNWQPLTWLWPYLVFDAAVASHQAQPITSIYGGLQLWPHGIVEFSLEIGWFAFSVDGDEITAPLVGTGRGVLYVGGAFAFRLGKRWP